MECTTETKPLIADEVNRLAHAAQDALDRGFSILAVEPCDKSPYARYSPHAVHSATRDADKALAPYEDNVAANYGVACGKSGLSVIDVDHGIKSLTELTAWMFKHHLPETLVVQSGREGTDLGYHLYYLGPRATTGFTLDGVTGEIKSDGGYVVGPGSRHPSGQLYRIVEDVPIVSFPEKVFQTTTPVPLPGKLVHKNPVIPIGNRYVTLRSKAGSLRNVGLSEDGIYQALKDFAAHRCEDGENYPDDKIKEIAKWAASDKCDETQDANPYSVGYVKGSFIPQPPTDWRSCFKNSSEMSDAALKFLIEYFLQEESLAFIGGLSGHGKTLIALAISKAFIYGDPLFGISKFKVTETLPVIYLIPESGEKSFKMRLKAFHLLEEEIFAKTGKKDMLLSRTFSQGEMLQLDDERLLQACEGRVVILDTAIRFSDANDENSAAENRHLAECVFRLIARGARKVIGLHHSGKEFEKMMYMTLENVLRGSGDYGAMCSEVYGVRMVDEPSSEIYVECVKGRDLNPVGPFVLKGRPYIDETGNFRAMTQPGLTPPLAQVISDKKSMKTENQQETIALATDVEKTKAFELYESGKTKDEVRKELGIGQTKALHYRTEWMASKAESTKGEGQ